MLVREHVAFLYDEFVTGHWCPCVRVCVRVFCARERVWRARACFLHVFLGFFSGHLLAPARALRIEHPFGARGRGSTVLRSRCGEIPIATMMYVPKMRTCSVHVHRSLVRDAALTRQWSRRDRECESSLPGTAHHVTEWNMCET